MSNTDDVGREEGVPVSEETSGRCNSPPARELAVVATRLDQCLRAWLDAYNLPSIIALVLEKSNITTLNALRAVISVDGALHGVGGTLSVWALLRHKIRPLHIALFHDACRATEWDDPLPHLRISRALQQQEERHQMQRTARSANNPPPFLHASSVEYTLDDLDEGGDAEPQDGQPRASSTSSPQPPLSPPPVRRRQPAQGKGGAATGDARDGTGESTAGDAAPHRPAAKKSGMRHKARRACRLTARWCRKKQVAFLGPSREETKHLHRWARSNAAQSGRSETQEDEEDDAPAREPEEAIFTESLALVKDAAARDKIRSIWDDTCPALVDLYASDLGEDAARAIGEALKGPCTYLSLSLDSNDLGDAGTAVLSSSLHWNHCLSRLFLSNNGITDRGGFALADMLMINTHLRELYLHDNSIGDATATALAKALTTNKSLDILELNNNHIGDEGGCALFNALTNNTSLRELDVRDNALNEAAGCALGHALKSNRALRRLNVKGNKLGREGGRAVGNSLLENLALNKLILDDNSIGDDAGQIIGLALQHNISLAKLHLRGNRLGAATGCAIGDALCTNTTLRELHLDNNSIGELGGRALGVALEKNTAIKIIGLHNSGLGARGLEGIASGLQDVFHNRPSIAKLLPTEVVRAIARHQRRKEELDALCTLGTVPIGTTKVFVCGDDGAGKTTLINTLQATPRWLDSVRIRRRKVVEEQEGAPEQVPGIQVHNLSMKPRRGHRDASLTANSANSSPAGGTASASSSLAGTGGSGSHAGATGAAGVVPGPAYRSHGASLSLLPHPTPLVGSALLSAASEQDEEDMQEARAIAASKTCELRVYDFARQLDFHVMHELLFADRNVVFVVCVDLSLDLRAFEKSLVYWLRFINTRLHQAAHRSPVSPHVVVVGTKADKPHPSHSIARSDASGLRLFAAGDELLCSRNFQQWFSTSMRLYPHVVPINGRSTQGPGMRHLRSLLRSAWAELVQQEVHVPKLVELVAAGLDACRQEDDGPWNLEQVYEFVQTAVEGLRAVSSFSLDLFKKALRYLHVRGDILWFGDVPALEDHIFVSPSWLLSNIITPAVAPDGSASKCLLSRYGEVTLEDFNQVFGDLMDAAVVAEVLSKLKLCVHVGRSKTGWCSGKRCFLLPSRLQLPATAMWEPDGSARVFAGRQLVVPAESGMLFPPCLFLRVQARVYPLFGDTMSMWQGGFAGLLHTVECFCRVQRDTIDVWVRGPDGCEEMAWMVLHMVMRELEVETEGIATRELVVSFGDLSRYGPNPAAHQLPDVKQARTAFITTEHTPGPRESACIVSTVTDKVANLLHQGLFL